MPPVLLLLACATQGTGRPDDATEYMRLLAADDLSTATRIEACLDLSDARLAGDCALAAAEAAPLRHEGKVEDWCPALPAGVWRDECLFQAAELALASHDRARATRLCLQAGRFTDECGYHMWQGGLRVLIHRDGPDGFVDHLPEAQALYDIWAPRLAATTDIEVRFWDRYFEMGFEPGYIIDVQACDPLEEPLRAQCKLAPVVVWRKRLENSVLRPDAQVWFCARTAMEATVEAVLRDRLDVPRLPGRLDTPPSPEFDEVVAQVRSFRCL